MEEDVQERQQTEDADVWAALARAGEALLDVGAGPALLERMCGVAVGELHCESSSIWILDRATSSYAFAATHPPPAAPLGEELRLPRERLEALAAGDQQEESARWLGRAELPLLLVPGEAAREVLCLCLARGGELIGVQVCGYREAPPARSSAPTLTRRRMSAANTALIFV